jgi:hypothetical protein
MTSPAAERKAEKNADEFLDGEFDDDVEAKTRQILKISAALEEAERARYSKAMPNPF